MPGNGSLGGPQPEFDLQPPLFLQRFCRTCFDPVMALFAASLSRQLRSEMNAIRVQGS